jgi:hypothetical protein
MEASGDVPSKRERGSGGFACPLARTGNSVGMIHGLVVVGVVDLVAGELLREEEVLGRQDAVSRG